MNIVVVQENPEKWIATIEGGWWVASSNTKESAIKKVIEHYEKEMNQDVSY